MRIPCSLALSPLSVSTQLSLRHEPGIRWSINALISSRTLLSAAKYQYFPFCHPPLSLMDVAASFTRLSSPRPAPFSVTNWIRHPHPNKTNLSFRNSRYAPICAFTVRSFVSNTEVLLDSKVETILDSMKWDSKGLAVAIAQNIDTGSILMQGFANRDALEKTILSRKATFYSRSRSSLWTKGETSMNFINVHDVFLDCDRDSIIYLGKPDGPTCHTGAETCYYTSVHDILEGSKEGKEERLAKTTLYSLEATISRRKEETETLPNEKPSWTKKLLLDQKLLCSKVREEAEELIQTLLDNEDKGRTASEMADLLYHSMVLLRLKDVPIEQVLEVLRKRFSQSGVEEKNSRKKN